MKTINTKELANMCKSYNSKYPAYAYKEMIDILSNVICDSLLTDTRDIKLGKIMKFKVYNKDKKQIWNGIDKRYEMLPEHQYIKLVPLTKIKEVNKFLLESKK